MNQPRRISHTFYIDKQKITFAFPVDPKDGPEEIEKKMISKKISLLVEFHDENMADWAREMGISRQAIYHVKEGRRDTRHIRQFIEDRLGQRLWS